MKSTKVFPPILHHISKPKKGRFHLPRLYICNSNLRFVVDDDCFGVDVDADGDDDDVVLMTAASLMP